MSEFPKKVWIDNTILDEFDTQRCPESDIAYIRADLVDDLAELLRLLYTRNLPLTKTMREGIVTALKQLEDSDE